MRELKNNKRSFSKRGNKNPMKVKANRDKVSIALKEHFKVNPMPRGENNKNWKGDKVTYWGLHKYITSRLGQPKFCQFCETTKAKCYDWANISGEYSRDLNDWVRLCRKCHVNFDGSVKKSWLVRKNK